MRRWLSRCVLRAACCAGDEGGDDLGGAPVKAVPCPVVAHRRSWVCVRGRFLHVAERDAGVETGGDEAVAERVRPDLLGDPRPLGDPPHDPSRRVAVKALAIVAKEDRAGHALADGEVDLPGRPGGHRDGDDLAALQGGGKSGFCGPVLNSMITTSPPRAAQSRSTAPEASDVSRPTTRGGPTRPNSSNGRRSGCSFMRSWSCFSLSAGVSTRIGG